MAIPLLEPQERFPFLCVAIASACAASAALTARAAADALFLATFGTHLLSSMYVGTSLLVGIVAYFFGRHVRSESLNRILIVSAAFLAALAVLLRLALILPWSGFRILAYFWGDLTVNGSMLLFWSFFGQVFTFRRAKRLMGWIGAGGTLACIAAGLLIRPFARQFGPENLLVVVAILMAGFGGAVLLLAAGSKASLAEAPARGSEVALPGISYYIGLLKTARIRSLALQAMVGTMVVILVDYQFKAVAQAHFAGQGAQLAAFFGDFYAVANVLVLLIQIFALHLFLQGRGLLTSLCVLPAAMLLGGSATILTVAFAAVVATKLAAQTTLFTIDSGAYQILYLGIKKQTRTQVRALVDGICRPAAIGLTGALLILISTRVQVYYLSAPGIVLCLVWFYLARHNYSYYLSGLVDSLSARLFDFSDDPRDLRDKSVEEYTRKALQNPKLEEIPYLLSVARQLEGADWSAEIGGLLKRPEPEVKIAALDFLVNWGKSRDPGEVLELAHHPVAEVRRAAVRAAGQSGEAVMAPIRDFLADNDPGVRAEAASALIDMGNFGGLMQGVVAVKDMLESQNKSYRIAVANPVSRLKVKGRTESLLQLLDDPEPEVRLAALRACANVPEPELVHKVLSQLWNPRTSSAAADALIALGPLTADYLGAYHDPAGLDAMVRRSALLPVILEKIASPRALEVLKTALDHAGPNATSETIEAYCRLLERQPEMEPHLSHWESVMRGQVVATNKRRALLARSASLAESDFLQDVLREELARHVVNVFTLLGPLAPTIKMDAIRSRLQEGDADQRANAMEVLEHVAPAQWRSAVLELADARPAPAGTATAADLLREVMDSDISESVLVGAAYAASRSQSKESIPLLQQLLAHPSGIVRETALFSLAQLEAPESLAERARPLLADLDPSVKRIAQRIVSGPESTDREGEGMIVVEKMLFLRQVPLFANMATGELTHVASIAREVTYHAGSQIIQEGEHGENMFLIVDGEVVIRRGETVLKTLHSKDFFGEMSIIDGEARSASVFASKDCLLLRIDREDFNDLLATYNSAAISVIRALIHRLREVLPALERAQRGM